MDLFSFIGLEVVAACFVIHGVIIVYKVRHLFLSTSGMKQYMVQALRVRNLFLQSLGYVNIGRGISLCFLSPARLYSQSILYFLVIFLKEFITLSFGSIFSLVLLMFLKLYKARTDSLFQNVFFVITGVSYLLFVIFGIIDIIIALKHNTDFLEVADTFIFAIIYSFLGILMTIYGIKLINQIRAYNLLSRKTTNTTQCSPLLKRISYITGVVSTTFLIRGIYNILVAIEIISYDPFSNENLTDIIYYLVMELIPSILIAVYIVWKTNDSEESIKSPSISFLGNNESTSL